MLPPKIAPIQVVIIPIWKKDDDRAGVLNAASSVKEALRAAGIKVKLDDSDQRSPGWKFNFWEMKGVPLRIEIGPRDVSSGSVVVSRRDVPGKQGKVFGISMEPSNLEAYVMDKLDEIQSSLLRQAESFRDSNILDVSSYDELKVAISQGKWARGPWSASNEDELKVKEETGATIRCFPFEQPLGIKRCLMTGAGVSSLLIDSIRFDRDGDCWKIERTGVVGGKVIRNLFPLVGLKKSLSHILARSRKLNHYSFCACTGGVPTTLVPSRKQVIKGYRSAPRRSRKPVDRSQKLGAELAEKSARSPSETTVSESEKLGVAVLGRRFGDKIEHVPIKKRRFMVRSPSPPPHLSSPHLEDNQPPLDGRRASAAACNNSINDDVNPVEGNSVGEDLSQDGKEASTSARPSEQTFVSTSSTEMRTASEFSEARDASVSAILEESVASLETVHSSIKDIPQEDKIESSSFEANGVRINPSEGQTKQ
ncbi:proline--tRNA ligase chloroplastic/mitochondrial [Prunus yedoensis var. nudiflora]|uniref:proline--tRNA ligase n=1 Tax=Prunus yedoensis var. nudiflora TaxID=2094558 RepID=A0A314ZPN5_PRUYE|nr:proline--tRNA ligase chloroplastic/mitochondrial [Prunus yedoensis var. nudiflora]